MLLCEPHFYFFRLASKDRVADFAYHCIMNAQTYRIIITVGNATIAVMSAVKSLSSQCPTYITHLVIKPCPAKS